MEIAFSRIKDEGGLEIRFVEDKYITTHVVDNHGYQTVHPYSEDIDYLRWARQKENKGTILISDVFPIVYESSYQKLIMNIASPVWQVSVDEMHPVRTNEFSGVLIFVVDVTALIEEITEDIRSGKTGYAWVIDNKGTFLYHPEVGFIGKNAFEARKEKKPTISFAKFCPLYRI
jgi:hypothetical protein